MKSFITAYIALISTVLSSCLFPLVSYAQTKPGDFARGNIGGSTQFAQTYNSGVFSSDTVIEKLNKYIEDFNKTRDALDLLNRHAWDKAKAIQKQVEEGKAQAAEPDSDQDIKNYTDLTNIENRYGLTAQAIALAKLMNERHISGSTIATFKIQTLFFVIPVHFESGRLWKAMTHSYSNWKNAADHTDQATLRDILTYISMRYWFQAKDRDAIATILKTFPIYSTMDDRHQIDENPMAEFASNAFWYGQLIFGLGFAATKSYRSLKPRVQNYFDSFGKVKPVARVVEEIASNDAAALGARNTKRQFKIKGNIISFVQGSATYKWDLLKGGWQTLQEGTVISLKNMGKFVKK